MDGKCNFVFPYAGDPREWAKRSFGSSKLGDSRRTRRLVSSAAKIAAHPEKSFTQIFDWNELRAFYNLCDQKEATLPAVQGPHWQQTRQAMAKQKLVLILHDTTELDFSSHQALKGAGPIGNGNGTGFLQHNSLAIVPEHRQILGLAYQQLRVRQPAPKTETSQQMRRRQRETEIWWDGIEAIGMAADDSCWVDVGDRGSDIYECMVAARKLKHHFLFRVTKDRSIFLTSEWKKPTRMKHYARSLSSQGTDTVEIPGRGGRVARTATVSLAAAPVWIPVPKDVSKNRKSQPLIAAYVIRIWEPNPPEGVEALEWILVCSLPTATIAEIKERRDWYGCRWLVEVFHDIEKNGCSEEDRRFETAERMETSLAILSVVAVRIFQLRSALEQQPNAAAEQLATETEIKLIRRYTKHKGKKFTVSDFVRGVAKLGGFLGRKRDGDPGVRALWRGYQRLQDMVAGFQLHGPPESA